MYSPLQVIIQDALTEQTINETMGEFQGVLRFLNNEFLAEKSTQPITDDALARLQRRSDEMYEHIGKVMQPNTACTGLAVFMVGATIHLAMLQEIALAHKNRGQTTGLAAAQASFRDYADHLSRTFQTMCKTRSAAVTVMHHQKGHTSITGGVWYEVSYHWHDKLGPQGHRNGGRFEYQYADSKSEKKAKHSAQKSRDTQAAALIKHLRTALGQPEQIAALWVEAGGNLRSGTG